MMLPAAMLLAAAPAMAQTEEETVITSTNHSAGTTTRSTAVSRGDLDLADGRDYARLQRRVSQAADRVCTDDGAWNRFTDFEYHRCYRAAVASAMAHVAATAIGAN